MADESPADALIPISVVYALPDRQVVVALEVTAGTTVAEAVTQSRLATGFPEIGASELNCAIYGRAVLVSQIVSANDRIEILRPLLIDPKEQRRRAATRERRR